MIERHSTSRVAVDETRRRLDKIKNAEKQEVPWLIMKLC